MNKKDLLINIEEMPAKFTEWGIILKMSTQEAVL